MPAAALLGTVSLKNRMINILSPKVLIEYPTSEYVWMLYNVLLFVRNHTLIYLEYQQTKLPRVEFVLKLSNGFFGSTTGKGAYMIWHNREAGLPKQHK